MQLQTKLSILAIAILGIAATPVKNDLVELTGFLNTREEAKFRASDRNKISVLPPGTKAVIQEVKRFSQSGNYGICLKVISKTPKPTQACSWVYYVPSRPTLKLLRIDSESEKGLALLKEWGEPQSKLTNSANENITTKDPKNATAAVVTKATEALEMPESAMTPEDEAKEANEAAVVPLAAYAAKKANEINQKLTASIDPNVETEDCRFCSVKIPKYQECNAKNSYIEKELDQPSNQNPQSLISSLLNTSDEARYIKDICFAGSLLSFGGPFKYCGPGDTNVPKKSVPPACVSERYNSLVRNSFEAAADCLGDYLSGNPATAKSSMIDIFGLMTVESGLHLNARSHTGAGGAGQLTSGAIEDINARELKVLKGHLAESKTPACRLVETALREPMKPQFSQSCERISLSKGNPLKNIIYTIAYQKRSRFFVRNYNLENPLFAKTFKALSIDDKSYLERQLGIWAHNTGDGALHRALRSYLRNYRGKKLTNQKDINEFLNGLRPYIRRHSGGRINANEPVRYWNKIQNRMKDLNKNQGDGSCIVGQK